MKALTNRSSARPARLRQAEATADQDLAPYPLLRSPAGRVRHVPRSYVADTWTCPELDPQTGRLRPLTWRVHCYWLPAGLSSSDAVWLAEQQERAALGEAWGHVPPAAWDDPATAPAAPPRMEEEDEA